MLCLNKYGKSIQYRISYFSFLFYIYILFTYNIKTKNSAKLLLYFKLIAKIVNDIFIHNSYIQYISFFVLRVKVSISQYMAKISTSSMPKRLMRMLRVR